MSPSRESAREACLATPVSRESSPSASNDIYQKVMDAETEHNR